MNLDDVKADLFAEQGALDEIVAAMSDDDWSTDTASPRWDVTDQIAHLTYFDRRAAQAIVDPAGFSEAANDLFTEAARSDQAGDAFTLNAVRTLPVGERIQAWRSGRAELAAAADTLAEDDRVEWYGPSMGAKSFLTARLMEVWAHGQDIVDAIGATRVATDRLRHIAQLGFITRGWAYINRRLEVPDTTVRVELEAPSGALWAWGPEDADGFVRGAAEDFCLVVTQRRNLADTGLEVSGHPATEWIDIAQAFAGPPSSGPRPSPA